MKTFLLITCSIASSSAFGRPRSRRSVHSTAQTRRQPTTALEMKPLPSSAENDALSLSSERRRTSLAAATLESMDEEPFSLPRLPSYNSETFGAVAQVISASLLVTGNTVGSSMFVLPQAVDSVGMAWGSALFVGIYLYNLISGLMLAEVAINLHETSDCEVPSSFKDFADCAMADSTSAGNAIGAASLLMNSCFLSYGMVQVGSFVSDTMDVGFLDPTAVAALYSLLLLVAFCTQKTCGIETIANMAVMVLFASFASLLLPSLAHVHPLFEAFAASSSAATTTTMPDGSLASALSATIPLIVSTMIYQNIVPSITKLLDFDRTKSTIAIALGSLLPMLMYVAWCFAVLGGGLDTSLENNGVGGAMFAAFTASSFVGSSIGCVLSLAEEYESILSSAKRRGDLDYEKVDSCAMTQCGFSVPAVVMSVLPPAAVALAASSGTDGAFTAPLHLSGAVIAPFLYGLLPIMLFRSMQSDAKSDVVSSDDFNLMDTIPQVLLGASTIGLLGNELVHDVGNWLS
ncbi:hypothetical protein ACHAWO_007098 [Cyclotella atomus]|uniref:Amino acid transporter transmembrane domain-containing protein n=1 Tax=Cyclotella atomus TaxID=382360 RepID=A0ABD3QL97_9STRA